MTGVDPAPAATGPVLAIDTSTPHAVAAIGGLDGRLQESMTWAAGQRHDEELLPRIGALLEATRASLDALVAVVVGTGPGAFTGLRVGLATAKTLAHELGLPIVGVSSAEALLLAASRAASNAAAPAGPTAPAGPAREAPAKLVLLLPAGSTDRLVVRPGRAAELLPGGRELELAPDEEVVAVDLAGRADPAALERGAQAVAGLPEALLALGASRVAAGEFDDVARLVPEYVTPPRGVAAVAGEIAWSRDPR